MTTTSTEMNEEVTEKYTFDDFVKIANKPNKHLTPQNKALLDILTYAINMSKKTGISVENIMKETADFIFECDAHQRFETMPFEEAMNIEKSSDNLLETDELYEYRKKIAQDTIRNLKDKENTSKN